MGYRADIDSSDNLIKVVKRLPFHLQSRWADKAGKLIQGCIEPRFEHLTKFVEERALLASTMYGQIVGSVPIRDNNAKFKPTRKPNYSPVTATTLMTQSNNTTQGKVQPAAEIKKPNQTCPLCSETHKLTRCEKFKEKSPQERRDFAMQARLCHNCLGRNHVASECRSEYICRVPECGKKHHTYLHPPLKSNNNNNKGLSSNVQQATANDVNRVEGSGNCGATGGSEKRVSLRIVPVTVKGKNSKNELETYALLDPGSDVSLCNAKLINKLGLQGNRTNFSLTTVNGQRTERKGHEVTLNVKGLTSDENIELSNVWTVD
jgi:hypothetical protein